MASDGNSEVKTVVKSQAEIDAMLAQQEETKALPDSFKIEEDAELEPRFFPKGNPPPDERRTPTMARGGIIKQSEFKGSKDIESHQPMFKPLANLQEAKPTIKSKR